MSSGSGQALVPNLNQEPHDLNYLDWINDHVPLILLIAAIISGVIGRWIWLEFKMSSHTASIDGLKTDLKDLQDKVHQIDKIAACTSIQAKILNQDTTSLPPNISRTPTGDKT